MRYLSVTLGIALLVGCSTAGGPTPQRSTTVISAGGSTGSVSTTTGDVGSRTMLPASAAEAWNAIAAAYASLGIEAGVLEPRTEYGTHRFVASRIAGARPSRMVNCGSGPFGAPAADSYEVSFSIRSQLRPAGDQSEVVTSLTATARPRGASGSTVNCTSTGWLEGRINEAITSRLASPG